MDNNFNSLGLKEPLLKAIDKMGFNNPTNVQMEAIPQILLGKDLIVMSKTGSGKTGAFGLPILQLVEESEEPQALILTPTRELAVQLDIELKKMSAFLELKTTAVYGQHNINTEIEAMKKGVQVITGTPGRVWDHIKRKTLNTNNLKYIVLDEADRMLDMGFIDQVIQIIKKTPKERVTLLFSATMPTEIKRICQSYMSQPLTIELEAETKTVDTVTQVYYRVKANEKRIQMDRLLKVEQPDSCMVFCNTRREVDKVQEYLVSKGYVAEALHGANAQKHRMKTIKRFKEGQCQILVATDVAARGIHIEDLALVMNYDIPLDKDNYVHRIGRTGRAGRSGKAINIVTIDDVRTLYEIEEHVGMLIDEEELPTDDYVNTCVEKSTSKWVGVEPPKPKPKHIKKKNHPKKNKKNTKYHEKNTNDGSNHSMEQKNKHFQKSYTDNQEKVKNIQDSIAANRNDNEKVTYEKIGSKQENKYKTNKDNHNKQEIKRQTVILPKVGAIDFITREEPKKKSLLERIKSILGR